MAEKAARVPLVVAVGGGKGGVGKTVVSLNLALAMTKLGARVIALDADLGSANLHTMLGIDHPKQTLQSLFDGRASTLSDVCIATDYENLSLVAGSVAVPGAANLHHARKLKLMRQIAKLDADVIVVDCGAGVNFNVIDFFAAADVRLLVATPQLVSLQNAYGFLKATLYRMLRQCALDAGKVELFEQASDYSEVETVRQLIDRIGERDRALAQSLRERLGSLRFGLLGNQLSDSREQNALHALSRMIGDFLTLQVPVLGALLRKDRIHAAVTRRKPFILDGSDAESLLLLQIAERYLTLQRAAHDRPFALTPSLTNDPAGSGGRPPDPLDRAASNATMPLPTSLARYERAHDRHRIDWSATIELGGFRQAGRVLDISQGGIKLELPRACSVGALLLVTVLQKGAPASLRARVVHVAGMIVGCVFDPPPPRAALAALLIRAEES
ncbi:MAG TPA: AAA family ATPase [Polyangiales bacterium]|nr:AAA family ATPase [Polyangiales bacterium]